MGTGLEEKSKIGIFDTNLDTGERIWSQGLSELFELPCDAPPDFRSVLQRVHPEDRRAFNASALEPFRPDCPARKTSQFRIVRADGSVHWMQLVRMTIFRENGAHDVVRILGFVFEISEPAGHQRPRQSADIAA
jgi:two-component system, sensor histidine kinase and response regulator